MGPVMGLFIIFPLGAAFIGILYLRMFHKLKVKTALVAGVLWLVYSVYEGLIYFRILCSGECNIRVDLLLIYPLLILVSVLATGLYYYQNYRQKNERISSGSDGLP